MTLNSTGQDQVYIYPTDVIPEIVQASTDTTTFTGTGASLATYTAVGGGTAGSISFSYVTDAGRGDTGIGPGGNGFAYNTGTGIITLTNPTEEIWIDSTINASTFAATLVAGGIQAGDSGTISVSYYLVVTKYATWADANARTNILDTSVGYLGSNYANVAGGDWMQFPYANSTPVSLRVDSNTNYFRIEIEVEGYFAINSPNTNPPIPSFSIYKPQSTITVRFGAVNGGKTVITPIGVQAYASFRNYMFAAEPTPGAPFFDVRGNARFQTGLVVTGSFSATTKNFKIEHPLDENKWLYHSSIEGPAADLIYRGTAQLENGSASVDIDSTVRMTDGTFEVLTKKPQLFLQNNQTFDRVKGYVESGSVYIICEDAGSNALIDWTVIAERNDSEVLSSEQYGADGNYVPEKIKRAYSMERDREMMEMYRSSSLEEVK
jgi:hypothetical protein